eukprot:CAMPEP_0172419290 /NCGR_PEP_ID=MMETSP1064-20121228/5737_1 /TAXON_ID=202472 /ORGANISM="Aulacoseira subarctica , Strain CCAP 1002/5" /LENGTH=423 /DNA_ID=CAMNT_0013158709 /DNA_START=161 /DNA_END=1432 /DNA_ORIENTATION=-
MTAYKVTVQNNIPMIKTLRTHSSSDSELSHMEYDYDEIFASSSDHESYKDKRLFNFTSFANYTSSNVAMYGCNLTVTLIDNRVPANPYNHRVWYMLESIASFAPYACVAIHTTACHVISHSENITTVPTKLHQTEVSARAIYDRSLPLHRRMMERGQVRIGILEIGSYNIKACESWDANNLYTNVDFWKNEFFDGIDSNAILLVQDDAILCRYFNVTPWKEYAYVGSPWDPDNNEYNFCDIVRGQWRKYAKRCSLLNLVSELPDSPGVCFGNGGVSLRNRMWTIQVLQECPFHSWNEDLYFSAVFNGFRAPLPTSFEASLFSAETILPDDVLLKLNITLSPIEIEETKTRLLGRSGIYEKRDRTELFDDAGSKQTLRTIPLFFHQAWRYLDPEFLVSAQMKKEYKFYQYIDPSQISIGPFFKI